MRNVLDISCRDNENKNFVFNIFFPEIVRFEIMWENMADASRPDDNIMWENTADAGRPDDIM